MRRGLVVDGLLHRPVEAFARFAGRAVGRAAGPVGVRGDDELAFRVDEDALAEDATRGETAVGIGPPLVPIAAARAADAGAFAGRVLQPAVGHDALPPGARAGQDELAEAGKVARRGLDAAAADLAAASAEDPRGRLLHAGGDPDLLRQV